MTDLIQLRGGTYAILNYLNIIYAEREVVLELDSGRFKVGNGVDGYRDLPYAVSDFIFAIADAKYALAANSAPRYPSIRERTSTSNVTLNCDDYSGTTVAALAVDTNVPGPTGTPRQGQGLRYRFTDDGTPHAISWGADFRELSIPLPVMTVASTPVYVEVAWNAQDALWDCLSVV